VVSRAGGAPRTAAGHHRRGRGFCQTIGDTVHAGMNTVDVRQSRDASNSRHGWREKMITSTDEACLEPRWQWLAQRTGVRGGPGVSGAGVMLSDLQARVNDGKHSRCDSVGTLGQ